MIKPHRIKSGDTIGIVATSFLFPDKDPKNTYYQEFLKAREIVESMGFKVQLADGIDKQSWWRAGTPKNRASQINSFFANPEIDVVMVHDGGQSAIGVLSHLDYSMIKQNPKIFIGFSDVTNILLALYRKSDLVTFHGPLFTYSFGKHWHSQSEDNLKLGLEHFKNTFTSSSAIGELNPITKWEIYREGESSGKLIGGNLGMFPPLLDTEYTPKLDDFEGNILFWEIDNVESYRIEKGLYQLKMHGVLDVISGMIIGKLPGIRPTAWPGLYQPSTKEIVLEVLSDYDFPIIAEFDIGHETVDLVLPLGVEARMKAKVDNASVSIVENALV